MIKSWVAGFKKPSRETRYGDSQVFIDTKTISVLLLMAEMANAHQDLSPI